MNWTCLLGFHKWNRNACSVCGKTRVSGQTDYPKDDDGDVLRLLAKHGADMSRTMDIDFQIAVPDEKSGVSIAELATERGYKTTLYQDEESGEWTCECTKSMLATYDTVTLGQKELNQIAQPYNGKCDGWGSCGNT